MLREKGRTMRKDQRGFTIVELLIAVAILAIVVASVCSFILVGSRSYASANSDISVQQEAQLALNQMSDVLIDTTRSVNYVGYDASGSPVLALKDSEFGFEPVAKSLIMYNGAPVVTTTTNPDGTTTTATTIEEGNGNKHYHFYWDKNDETLYYFELPVQPDDVDAENNINVRFPAFGDPGWVVLAEHVTKFEVDLTQVEEKRVVQLNLTFVNGKREYNTSNNVTIRNKVAVNDAEIGPLNRKKTLSIIARETSVILEPGETYHFSTPKVTGQNVTDKSVTWSLVSPGSPSGGTYLTDTANGILKIAADEPAASFDVVITTNAVDSDGNHASCTIVVYIKRATGINMYKSADTNEENGPNEISPGCTFTISANVVGPRLGETCSACGESTEIDHYVSWEGNPYGNIHVWRIVDPQEYNPSMSWWKPKDYLKLIDQDQHSATFYLEKNTPDDGSFVFVVQAMSLLSTYPNEQGRCEYFVGEAIELKSVKGKENAAPLGGSLKYGEETLIKEIVEDLSTEGHKYVTCVRVVDNSGASPDRILLYFTTGDGADYRIAPDLFDLDLNGSYTFYMQALDPVSKENHKLGNHHQSDSNQEIWDEYINHLSPTKPYGYVGDKYDYRKVYYSVLDKPKLTFSYNNVSYKGKNITYDPVNIYSVGNGTGIVGEIKPTGYENIVQDNSVWTNYKNSLYEGEGTDISQWKKIYVFDEGTMSYEGKKEFAGKVTIDPKGSMFMKLEHQGDILGACGNYHIVPGMVYQNKQSDRYRIIGWSGFDFPNLPRKERYYEFDDSIIHVKVTSEFTMNIQDDWFKGQVLFPLPAQMAGNVLFPNMESADWQMSSGSWSGAALRDGQTNSENIEFSYVRYKYSKEHKAYYVEPVKVDIKAGEKKIVTHSYGVYVFEENGTKWDLHSKGYTTEKAMNFNVKQFDYNGGQYQTYFPLPTESDFPFTDTITETYTVLGIYNDGLWNAANLSGVLVKAQKNGDSYRIQFIKKNKANIWDVNNHKITVASYGVYTWSPEQTEWHKQEGYKPLPDEKDPDWVVNLTGLNWGGKTYMMYFPLPSEGGFPFSGSVKEIKGYKPTLYETTDIYGEHADTYKECTVKYEYSGGIHRIVFGDQWNTYGTFQCPDGGTSWSLVP